MKKILIIILICLNGYTSIAQNRELDSLKNLLTATTDLSKRYDLILQITGGYYRSGSGENTVNDNLELVRIATKLKDDSMIARGYNFAGDFYLYNRGDNNTALDYFFKGIPYAEKGNVKRWLSSLYLDMADAYWSLQSPTEELSFLKKAEANLPDKNHPEYSYTILQLKGGYAQYYLNINQPKMALPYISAFDELNQQLQYKIYSLLSNTFYATYYSQLGEIDIAVAFFKKALVFDSAVNVTFQRGFFKYNFLNFLITTGDYIQAKNQANELLKISEQSKNNFFLLKATGFLKNIYEKENKIDSAFYYSKLESTLKDSVFNQEKLNRTQSLNFNEEIRAKQAEEERHQNIQFVSIAFGIIIFIILFLLFSRSIVANERFISFFGVLGLLIVFEFINLLFHPWLAHFTHESPVLMLLALVLIASLLIPLHHRLEKWIKEKMIEKNKAIRLAAAKKTIEQLEKTNTN